MIQSSVNSEQLIVVEGEQAGATIDVSDKDNFSVGSGYDNDVVLRCCSEPVSVQIETQRGHRYIKLLEGAARIRSAAAPNVELDTEKFIKITPDTSVELGNTAFTIKIPEPFPGNEARPSQDGQVRADHGKRNLALASITAGIALLAALGFHEYWMKGNAVEQPHLSVVQQLEEQGLTGIHLLDEDSNNGLKTLQGRVDDQEQFQIVQRIASDSDTPIKLDVQVDSAIVDALQDIYRNHGVDAEISLLGKGHVKIEMQGVSEQTLESIESALKADLPMLEKVETINLPAEEIPEEAEREALDPEKEVEAVIAGDVSYVITRDQSRYFVGAVLPSGYTITSIKDGTVVMVKEGEETTLNF